MDEILTRIIKEIKLQKKKQKDLTNFLGIGETSFGSWKSGQSSSYKKYLHAIAQFLDVSVEYLKGETDIKKPPSENGERLEELYKVVKDFDETEMALFKAYAEWIRSNRK